MNPTPFGRRPYADLVFHVLAHVSATRALPASVFDPWYVTKVARALGPAGARALGGDAELLGRVVQTHESLGRLGLVALLHEDIEAALAAAELDLAALTTSGSGARGSARRGAGVTRPWLSALAGLEPAVEILRCAALLEHEHWACMAHPPALTHELRTALALVTRAAPTLPKHPLVLLPSLGLRGRAMPGESRSPEQIWVGLPTHEAHPTPLHAAWQAAHEATVVELTTADLTERETEVAALALLARRAEAAALPNEHAVWLATLDESCQAAARGELPERLERAVRKRLSGAECGRARSARPPTS